MLTKDNFIPFILSIRDRLEEELGKEREYIYFYFNSYGALNELKATNDNDGKYIEEVTSEEWDGCSYLILSSEIQDIIDNN